MRSFRSTIVSTDLRRADVTSYILRVRALTRAFERAGCLGIVKSATELLVWPHFYLRDDKSGPFVGIRRLSAHRRSRIKLPRESVDDVPGLFIFNLCAPNSTDRQGRARDLCLELVRYADRYGYRLVCVVAVRNTRTFEAYVRSGFVEVSFVDGGERATLVREPRRS